MKSFWEENADFVKGEKLARKAKDLIDQADLVEEEAKKRLDKARKARIKQLTQRNSEISEKLAMLREKELKNCKLKEEKLLKECAKLDHVYIKTGEKVNLRITHGHTFMGDIHPAEEYFRCVVCGDEYCQSTDSTCLRPVQTEDDVEIPEAHKEMLKRIESEFDESYKELLEKISCKQKELNEIKEGILEICELFGHEAEKIINSYEETFKCKCCGQIMGYQTYVNTYWNAKFHNVIPCLYSDYGCSKTILR